MKYPRAFLAVLALAAFTFAIAEEPAKDGKHHETTASESKGKPDSKEANGCGQCNGCASGAKKMVPPKVRETGPLFPDYMS
jgi:hypothetical protein